MYVKRFTPGEVHLPRVGFMVADQEEAMRQCSIKQMAIQEGKCGLCGKPIYSRLCWMRCDQNKKPLRKWAFEENCTYDSDAGLHVFTHRSPEEIKAEYNSGRHEIIHFGCVLKYRNKMWGHAGHTRTHELEYKSVLREWGFEDSSTAPADAQFAAWNKATKILAEKRRFQILEAGKKGVSTLRERNPEWGTGAWRGRRKPVLEPKAPKKEWHGKVKETRTYRTTTNRVRRLGEGPEADRALREASAAAAARPETDWERQSRELLESMNPG